MRALRWMLAPAVVLTLICTAGSAAANIPGNGYTDWEWGTTADTVGINIGPTSDRTCVLSAVAGDLNQGSEWYSGMPSVAEVAAWSGSGASSYALIAHGGAYTNQVNQPVAVGNPVVAGATCFWTTARSGGGVWQSQESRYGISPPVKIADSAPGRQCFLSAVTGVGGSWSDPGPWSSPTANFARVIQTANGWYVEGNQPSAFDASHAEVAAVCIDFPAGTNFSTGWVHGYSLPITSGSGVKACGLTGIQGPFNKDNWSDGAFIQAPSTLDGNWTMTVSAGKAAWFTCIS